MVARSSTAVPGRQAGAQEAPACAAARPSPARRRRRRRQSFAALTAKLDYLDAADIQRVRDAYRFADEAHLGQFRASGEPYITHPIAVAGLCAEWKLDAQAIMAALMHDAMEDCGITKAELIERFGAPIADLVDGLTKLDKLRFSTREEIAGRVVPQDAAGDGARRARHPGQARRPPAQHAHDGRGRRAPSGTRIAAETLEIYAPIAHRLGLNQTYRELQELSFKHLQPWREAALSKAVQKARGYRRDIVERIQQDVEKAFAAAKLTAQIFGREKTLYSIYRKMREKHLSSRRSTTSSAFASSSARCPSATWRSACCTSCTSRCRAASRTTSRSRRPTATSRCTRRWSARSARARRVPDPHRADARGRREGHRRALALQGARRRPGARPARRSAWARMWLQSLLDIQDETRDAGEFLEHVKIDLFPDAVYVFTPRAEDPGAAARRDAGRLRLRDPHRRRRPLRRRQHQRRAGAAAHRAEERRRRRGHQRAERAPESGLAQLRAHRPRPLQDPPLPEEHGAGGVAEPRREDAGAGAARRRPRRCRPTTTPAPAIWEQLLRFTGNRSRDELFTDIGLAQDRDHRRQAPGAPARRGRRAARCADADDGPLRRRRLGAVARRGADRRQRKRLGAVRARAAGRSRATRSSATSAAAKAWWCTPPTAASASACSSATASASCASTGPSSRRARSRPASRCWSRTARACWPRSRRRWPRRSRHHPHRHGRGAGEETTELQLLLSVRDRLHLAEVMRTLKRSPAVLRVARVKP